MQTLNPYITSAEKTPPTRPPAAPSTVLLGLTLGMSLCLPKARPKKSAKPSLPTETAKAIHTKSLQCASSLVASRHSAMMGSAG